jgi:hypothetical protein
VFGTRLRRTLALAWEAANPQAAFEGFMPNFMILVRF